MNVFFCFFFYYHAETHEEPSAGNIAAKYNEGGHAYQELSEKYQVCEQAYRDLAKEHEELVRYLNLSSLYHPWDL